MPTDSRQALSTLQVIIDRMKQEGINRENAEDFLIILKVLLNHPVMGDRFMALIGELAQMPVVTEKVSQHPFGMTGLKIFCNYVKEKYGGLG